MLNDSYLGNEICAVSDDWLIVWDGKYNFCLFDSSNNRVSSCFKRGQMPYNEVSRGKRCEYYTVYDVAVKNLCKVAANNGFFDFTRKV